MLFRALWEIYRSVTRRWQLLCTQKQYCVRYLQAKSSGYLVHNFELWSNFCASTQNQGVATKRLFFEMVKCTKEEYLQLHCRLPLCVLWWVYKYRESIESPALGNLRSRFLCGYKQDMSSRQKWWESMQCLKITKCWMFPSIEHMRNSHVIYSGCAHTIHNGWLPVCSILWSMGT